MTFPSVRSSSSDTTASTTPAPTMPATIVAGDLIVALSQINATATWSATTGYTEKGVSNRGSVHARVATGDANDTIGWTLSSLNGVAWTIIVIQDWEGTLAGFEIGTFDAGTDMLPFSPSWGSADTFWMEGVFLVGGTLPSVSAWSTSYTEINKATGNFSVDVFAGAAGRANATATESPDDVTFTGSPTATRTVMMAVEPGAGGITGTLAETEADDTLSASGTHTPPAITGTLAETEADDTLAGSGTSTPPAITGTLAETEAADTLAASGTFTPAAGITGTLAETEENDTLDASGTFTPAGITGSLAVTEAADTLSASGVVVNFYTGTLAETEEDDTLSASGTVTGTHVDLVVTVGAPRLAGPTVSAPRLSGFTVGAPRRT